VLRVGAIPVDRLRAVCSIIVDDENFPQDAEQAADVKPAAPHPLEAGPVDPATGEPPA